MAKSKTDPEGQGRWKGLSMVYRYTELLDANRGAMAAYRKKRATEKARTGDDS